MKKTFLRAKIADSIERNAFFNENPIFFFFLETFVCQRFGLKCSDLSADPLTPPARILTRTAQNSHVLHFFFWGGGGGLENKMIKNENPPGLGLALAPDGRQPAQVSPAQNRQTSRPTRCIIHILFPIWAAVPSANTAC